nr:MAG TPA: hypothetical protein [Caudoviricetes sp.]
MPIRYIMTLWFTDSLHTGGFLRWRILAGAWEKINVT